MNTLTKERFPWKAFIKSVMAIAVPVALQNLLTTTGSMIANGTSTFLLPNATNNTAIRAAKIAIPAMVESPSKSASAALYLGGGATAEEVAVFEANT